jgi:hypothetical protein
MMTVKEWRRVQLLGAALAVVGLVIVGLAIVGLVCLVRG